MYSNFLDFEKPLIELESKITSLVKVNKQNTKLNINIEEEIRQLRQKNVELTKRIFSKLTPWQIVQLSRHPKRPYTLDYINFLFEEFDELSGDRSFGDDKAIVGGIARLDKKPIIVIGHQKGRDTKEKILRNFGMPSPEGYRKSLILMKLAERFNIPVITFIDTPGAHPGIKAEEHGQARAIAQNLKSMSRLKIPIVCNVIGEGGSGGALAIGVGDKINMLQYSIYSVISPEGCASILWKDVKKASLSASAMGIEAHRLKKLGLIDSIIKEPLGGAHRSLKETAKNIKIQILEDFNKLKLLDKNELIQRRYHRLMSYGYI